MICSQALDQAQSESDSLQGQRWQASCADLRSVFAQHPQMEGELTQ